VWLPNKSDTQTIGLMKALDHVGITDVTTLMG
jgi:hypothetical protein